MLRAQCECCTKPGEWRIDYLERATQEMLSVLVLCDNHRALTRGNWETLFKLIDRKCEQQAKGEQK
jgi:hypothetical protein